ncbi:hypothetical protein BYT27DRAFT_6860125 [Phlegmacium glaucopus]|nr:hypothetical protein BYT27DRAFT_6860125 [Phlegmacium glaucopus]
MLGITKQNQTFKFSCPQGLRPRPNFLHRYRRRTISSGSHHQPVVSTTREVDDRLIAFDTPTPPPLQPIHLPPGNSGLGFLQPDEEDEISLRRLIGLRPLEKPIFLIVNRTKTILPRRCQFHLKVWISPRRGLR